MPGGELGAAMTRAAWHRSLLSGLVSVPLRAVPHPARGQAATHAAGKALPQPLLSRVRRAGRLVRLRTGRPMFSRAEPLPPGWAAIRAAQLAAFPCCAECGAAATEVHHVHGRAAGHGPDNLASLCSPCHMRLTGREGGWLSGR